MRWKILYLVDCLLTGSATWVKKLRSYEDFHENDTKNVARINDCKVSFLLLWEEYQEKSTYSSYTAIYFVPFISTVLNLMENYRNC